jgi:RNA polymerase sigma-70 factor (ECF subfamily)
VPLPQEDWYEILRRLTEGDRLALLRLSRLLNGFLARWNAYDFRDEWDDLIQEVVIAAVVALREGRFRDRASVVGWLRSTARFKFVDRLRSHLRTPEGESVPWEEVVERVEAEAEGVEARELREDLQRALARIPEKKRLVVLGVYVHGKTYDEVAAESGIPLGTLKRYLRDGLAELREELRALVPAG